MKKLIASLALIAMTTPVWAATKTVTLSIPGMIYAACPITVKKALTKVAGVTKGEASLDRREATITFDDTKADIDALTRATRDAGYPSSQVGSAK